MPNRFNGYHRIRETIETVAGGPATLKGHFNHKRTQRAQKRHGLLCAGSPPTGYVQGHRSIVCSAFFAISVVLQFLDSGSVRGAAAAADLEQGFLHPPDSARPRVDWFVMDGNLSREGITADFEAMKQVGLGGVRFMEVDVGIPKGPTKFMSPPWRELFKHANAEAGRLGLEMTMPASPGWTGSGGPWVKPEHSMQKLVTSETNVAGLDRIPEPRPISPAVFAFPSEGDISGFVRQDPTASGKNGPARP